MAKYIMIPQDIMLRNLVTGDSLNRALSFYEFVQGTLLVDKRFGKSIRELQAAMRIGLAVRGVEAGRVVMLESQDWELLRDVAREPEGGYQPGVGVQILTFLTTIIDHAMDVYPGNGEVAKPKASQDTAAVVL